MDLAFKSGEEITDVWGGLRTRLVSSFRRPEPHAGYPYTKHFEKRNTGLAGRNDGRDARSHPFSPKSQWRTLPCRAFPVTKVLQPGNSTEFRILCTAWSVFDSRVEQGKLQTSVLLCVSPVPKIFSSLRAVPKKIRGWWRESSQMDIEVCARFEQFLNMLSRGGFFLRTLTRPKERKKSRKK